MCVCVVFDRSVYVCVVRGMPSRCWSTGENECVVSGRPVCLCVCVCVCVVFDRSVYVCVWFVECRVGIDLLERVSVWCWAGPFVCVCAVCVCVYVCGVWQVRLCVSYEEY